MVRLFKHYVPYAVVFLGLLDALLLLTAAEWAWTIRAHQIGMAITPIADRALPLMSFGGSGILANCVALAILLRIDWENRQIMRGGSA